MNPGLGEIEEAGQFSLTTQINGVGVLVDGHVMDIHSGHRFNEWEKEDYLKAYDDFYQTSRPTAAVSWLDSVFAWFSDVLAGLA